MRENGSSAGEFGDRVLANENWFSHLASMVLFQSLDLNLSGNSSHALVSSVSVDLLAGSTRLVGLKESQRIIETPCLAACVKTLL